MIPLTYSLSTTWSLNRHPNIESMVNEAASLSFVKIEASYNCTEEHHTELRELVERGRVEVTSLHNYSPTIPGRPAGGDAAMLSSTDPIERQTAVDFTKRTLDAAVILGAKAVVLHLGQSPGGTDPTWQFREDVIREQWDIETIRARALEIMAWRAKYARPGFDAVVESIAKLAPEAQARGLALGLENRQGHSEIPSIDEMGELLGLFTGPSVGYWHDIGHGEFQERLGFGRHIDYLKRFGNRMVGMHIHDVAGLQDHVPPGAGTVDYSKLAPYIPDSVIKVIELHRGISPDAVKGCVPLLASGEIWKSR